MPKADLAFEIEDADHYFTLGVITSQGQGSGVRQHGGAGDVDAQDRAVLLGGVLQVGRGVVGEPGGW